MKEPIPGFDRYWLEVRRSAFNIPMEVETITRILELTPGTRVFDAGCGPGRISNPLAEAGADVVGVDISSELLEMAAVAGSGAVYLQGDYLEEPSGEAESFDAVLSWHTSWGYDTHAKNLQFFDRAFGLLKTGGRLLFQVWNPLGLPEQMSHWHRAEDGALILEILDFSPKSLLLEMERAVIGPERVLREFGQCQTYTYLEIEEGLLKAGFSGVEGVSVPIDYPIQVIKATKGSVS